MNHENILRRLKFSDIQSVHRHLSCSKAGAEVSRHIWQNHFWHLQVYLERLLSCAAIGKSTNKKTYNMLCVFGDEFKCRKVDSRLEVRIRLTETGHGKREHNRMQPTTCHCFRRLTNEVPSKISVL